MINYVKIQSLFNKIEKLKNNDLQGIFMANKGNHLVGTIGSVGVAGVALAILGSVYFGNCLGKSLSSPNKQTTNAQHVLADKVGFEYSGTLKDGRDFYYSIIDGVGDVWETVSIKDKNISSLTDYNHDRSVDKIRFGYDTKIEIRSPGKFEYDSSRFDKAQVEFIVETANQLYSEALSSPDIEKRLKSYSTRIQGNPLLPEPQAEKEN